MKQVPLETFVKLYKIFKSDCVWQPAVKHLENTGLAMDQSYSLLAQYHNTPLLPQKFCIGIVLDFPWDIFISQEKLQTMIMQNLGGGGGGVKGGGGCGPE